MAREKRRILVVDHRALARRTLAVLLRGLDYDVLEADSGEACLVLARSARPDLILMAVELPGLSGIEATRRLHDQLATEEIPIITMGTYATRETVLSAVSAGACDFIVRPSAKAATIAAKVEAALAKAGPAPGEEATRIRERSGAGEKASGEGGGEGGPPLAAQDASPKPGAATRGILHEIDRRARPRSISAAVVELYRVTGRTDSSPEEIAAAIESDPGLPARMLRAVNSAYYGHTFRIRSVRQAVVQLGLSGVREVAVCTEVFKAFAGGPGSDAVGLWEHALATAAAARNLAGLAGVEEPELLHLAGLLHDVGRPILADAAGPAYAKVLERARASRAPLSAAEREILQTDHCEAGGRVLRSWCIPEVFARVAEFHHAPWRTVLERAGSSLREVGLVRAANALATALGIGPDAPIEIDPLPEAIAGRIGLDDPSAVDAATTGVQSEVEKLRLLYLARREGGGAVSDAPSGGEKAIAIARDWIPAVDPVAVAFLSAGYACERRRLEDLAGAGRVVIVLGDRPGSLGRPEAVEALLERAGLTDPGRAAVLCPARAGDLVHGLRERGIPVVPAPFRRRELLGALEARPQTAT